MGVSTLGVDCAKGYPGVFAKMTKEVKSWIRSVAAGTQDSNCDKTPACEDCGLEWPQEIGESSGEDEIKEDYGSDYKSETENLTSTSKNIFETSTAMVTVNVPTKDTEEHDMTIADPLKAEAHLLKFLAEINNMNNKD